LVGRPAVLETRLQRFGLKIRPGIDFEVINPEEDPRYRDYVDLYLSCAEREGVTPDTARTVVRTNVTVIAALAVKRNDADAMICGLVGGFEQHLEAARQIIGRVPGLKDYAALSLLISPKGALFLTDT